MWTPSELEILVTGLSEVSAEGLFAILECDADGWSLSEPPVTWLFEILSSWSNAKRSLFLEFVRARSRLPAVLDGNALEASRIIIKKNRQAPVNALPTASTCFGFLNLGPYTSKQVLERLLEIAVAEKSMALA
jgi:hypothetical protein